MLMILELFLLMLALLQLLLFSTTYHFLSSLLYLESIVLLMLVFIVIINYKMNDSLSVFLFVLTLAVCEASLGLTLLISFLKLKSNDLISSCYS
uniref:NADH dehydrogenase subunit 4L n=1 Tax=Zaptyx asperata TaxID=1885689 RepID=A0A224A1A1_9EUPU|nr:NADH dehydrogenase subunit 4L [Zaptyx asperata]